MVAHSEAGKGISGERIEYQFGYVPESADQRKGFFQGHMKNSGFAVVQERLFAVITLPAAIARASLTSALLDSIECQEARFACIDKPALPGRKSTKSGRHTGYEGVISGGAAFTITKPLAGRGR